jgi:hypothetical protein
MYFASSCGGRFVGREASIVAGYSMIRSFRASIDLGGIGLVYIGKAFAQLEVRSSANVCDPHWTSPSSPSTDRRCGELPPVVGEESVAGKLRHGVIKLPLCLTGWAVDHHPCPRFPFHDSKLVGILARCGRRDHRRDHCTFPTHTFLEGPRAEKRAFQFSHVPAQSSSIKISRKV